MSLFDDALVAREYHAVAKYFYGMDEGVLDEIQDNTREAGQRLRASLNLMRSQHMTEDGNYDDLATRLRTALLWWRVLTWRLRDVGMCSKDVAKCNNVFYRTDLLNPLQHLVRNTEHDTSATASGGILD